MFLKTTKLFVSALIVSLLIIISGCGGGGDDAAPVNTPSSTETTYNFFDPQGNEPGYRKTAALSGSSSLGDQFTGTLSLKTLDNTIFNGETVVQKQVYLSLTNTINSFSTSGISTIYQRVGSRIPVYRFTDAGVTFTPTNAIAPPATCKIGDFGLLASWEGSDGTEISGTWEVLNAGNGLADIVTIADNHYSTGELWFTEKATYTIDESGDIKRYSVEIYYADNNVTITLSDGVN